MKLAVSFDPICRVDHEVKKTLSALLHFVIVMQDKQQIKVTFQRTIPLKEAASLPETFYCDPLRPELFCLSLFSARHNKIASSAFDEPSFLTLDPNAFK